MKVKSMLSHELFRILRNPKWKYGIFILLFCIAYFIMTRQSSSQVTSMFAVNIKDIDYMLSIMPVFLTCFLLYQIAFEEERQESWKTLLVYPVGQEKRIFAKLLVLLLMQIPIMLLSFIVYFILHQSFSMMLFHYALCVQLIYLLSFMYYTFVVSNGYLDQGGSIIILNVLKTTTPIFLLFCILNTSAWMRAFHQIWWFVCICFVFMIFVLFRFHDELMRRKLYRETILYKVFGGIASNSLQSMLGNVKDMLDKLLQSLLKLYARNSKKRWKSAAAIEVGLKLNGFYVLIGVICLLLWKSSEWIFFLVLAIIAFIYVLINCMKERKRIQSVRIIPKENT
ncbi:hypothetical protein ACWG0P_05440 [Amedibacillus sp. YH-ame6]